MLKAASSLLAKNQSLRYWNFLALLSRIEVEKK